MQSKQQFFIFSTLTSSIHICLCFVLSFPTVRAPLSITSYDLNPLPAIVQQRHLVTIAHLKFWGYGACYSTIFTVEVIMSLFTLPIRVEAVSIYS